MKNIVAFFLVIQFYFSQDKGLSSFEKKDYKQSYDYYLNVLDNRKNDISAKFGAGISAFKNQDVETGMKYLQEVSIKLKVPIILLSIKLEGLLIDRST